MFNRYLFWLNYKQLKKRGTGKWVYWTGVLLLKVQNSAAILFRLIHRRPRVGVKGRLPFSLNIKNILVYICRVATYYKKMLKSQKMT